MKFMNMSDKKIDELFRRYYEPMYVYAFSILYDEEEAKDCVCEAWCRILERQTDIDEKTASSYLLRTVHNGCANRLRSMSVEERMARLMPLEIDLEIAPLHEFENELKEKEARQESIINYIRSSFSEETQDILWMRYKEELSYSQIAVRLKVSVSAVNKHISGALKKLRSNFKHYGK